MKAMLINVPSRKGQGAFMLPLGLLYVSRIFKDNGWETRIVDPYLDNAFLKDYEEWLAKLENEVAEFDPGIVGFSGIATSYPRAKEISAHLKKRFPRILQLAGGALSSTHELLLTHTHVDVVFHGETEISLPQFLSNTGDYGAVKGISYRKDGVVVRNSDPEQVKDLDTIPFPDYDSVDVKRYFHNTADWIRNNEPYLRHAHYAPLLERVRGKDHYLPIVSGRGCTHRCSFCYRHMTGVRKHSVAYTLRHMKHLRDKYKLTGFQFCDELFNPGSKWVLEFCDALEREMPDIFYIIVGARVNFMNEIMLKRLKETGCVEISYGHESGSDTVLKEYQKGVTSAQNVETTLLTQQAGIIVWVQLVIGALSESDKTIEETIDFLKKSKALLISTNYLIPLPETPVWEHVTRNNLVPDVEAYLERIANVGGFLPINMTGYSDKKWRSWFYRISRYQKLVNARENGILRCMYYFLYLDTIKNALKTLVSSPGDFIRKLRNRI